MLPIGLTTIANNALILLASSRRIDDINQAGSVAAQARDLFPILIPAMLAMHPWNFALARAEVARSNAEPMAGAWPWQYDKPADCLRWLPWDREQPEFFRGVEEGRYFLTSHEGPIVVRYIANVDDVSRWSPLFVSALTAELAYHLAETVSASQSMRDRMEARRDNLIAEAKKADGLATNQPQRLRPENISNALAAMHRRGSGYGGDPRRWHR